MPRNTPNTDTQDISTAFAALAAQLSRLTEAYEAATAEPSLTRQQAAEYLAISDETLKQLDLKALGPPAVRVGRRWTYLRRDLDLWRRRNRFDPAALQAANDSQEAAA